MTTKLYTHTREKRVCGKGQLDYIVGAVFPRPISYSYQAFTHRQVIVVPGDVFNTGQSVQYNRYSEIEA